MLPPSLKLWRDKPTRQVRSGLFIDCEPGFLLIAKFPSFVEEFEVVLGGVEVGLQGGKFVR
jgi:hypothetical protein